MYEAFCEDTLNVNTAQSMWPNPIIFTLPYTSLYYVYNIIWMSTFLEHLKLLFIDFIHWRTLKHSNNAGSFYD